MHTFVLNSKFSFVWWLIYAMLYFRLKMQQCKHKDTTKSNFVVFSLLHIFEPKMQKDDKGKAKIQHIYLLCSTQSIRTPIQSLLLTPLSMFVINLCMHNRNAKLICKNTTMRTRENKTIQKDQNTTMPKYNKYEVKVQHVKCVVLSHFCRIFASLP